MQRVCKNKSKYCIRLVFAEGSGFLCSEAFSILTAAQTASNWSNLSGMRHVWSFTKQAAFLSACRGLLSSSLVTESGCREHFTSGIKAASATTSMLSFVKFPLGILNKMPTESCLECQACILSLLSSLLSILLSSSEFPLLIFQCSWNIHFVSWKQC